MAQRNWETNRDERFFLFQYYLSDELGNKTLLLNSSSDILFGSDYKLFGVTVSSSGKELLVFMGQISILLMVFITTPCHVVEGYSR